MTQNLDPGIAGATPDCDHCCRANDFYRILTEPEHNMIRQQQALLDAEGLDLHFTDAAIREALLSPRNQFPAFFSDSMSRLLTLTSILVSIFPD